MPKAKVQLGLLGRQGLNRITGSCIFFLCWTFLANKNEQFLFIIKQYWVLNCAGDIRKKYKLVL